MKIFEIASYDKELTKLWWEFFNLNASADYYSNEGERKGVNPQPYITKATKVLAIVKQKYGTETARLMNRWANEAVERTQYGRGWSEKRLYSALKKVNVDPDAEGFDWDITTTTTKAQRIKAKQDKINAIQQRYPNMPKKEVMILYRGLYGYED